MIGLNVRKLVALDMLFLGKRVIVAEYAAGIVLPGALGLASLMRGGALLGIVLLWIALNYVPLFLHAVDLARHGTARAEAGADFADRSVARSYSWRQLWILVPFGVVVQDIAQRASQPKS